MKVSIIIVNYNTFQHTCTCIESVIKFTKNVSYEIILVDNASPNDNPDDFLVQFPTIILIKNAENSGFAKGNNIGIAAAQGDIILLLNSDTILIEDSISRAVIFLKNDPSIGAITTRLIYPDGGLQHTARKFRSIRNELLDMLRPLLWLLPYKKRALLMLNQYFNGDFNTYCDWVSGAFMMFRKEILSNYADGKLDERFFMYVEDQLWCYQFTKFGYRNYYLSDTTVIHIGNASTDADRHLQLRNTLLKNEIELMKYRKGRTLYYFTFKLLYTFKEKFITGIKIILNKLFNYKLR